MLLYPARGLHLYKEQNSFLSKNEVQVCPGHLFNGSCSASHLLDVGDQYGSSVNRAMEKDGDVLNGGGIAVASPGHRGLPQPQQPPGR